MTLAIIKDATGPSTLSLSDWAMSGRVTIWDAFHHIQSIFVPGPPILPVLKSFLDTWVLAAILRDQWGNCDHLLTIGISRILALLSYIVPDYTLYGFGHNYLDQGSCLSKNAGGNFIDLTGFTEFIDLTELTGDKPH
ncbi:hypothetical protein F5880DRAFT_1512653 [Lentinula raphanica]|nr:hypothetical protein F5880DRAFT_1512653 [Lentinula raphanica]